MYSKLLLAVCCLAVCQHAFGEETHVCLTRDPAKTEGTCMASLTSMRWPIGSTLRIAFLDGDPSVHARVKAAANEWTKYANLTFDFGAPPNSADIRISFRKGGSWSRLGTDAKNVPAGEPTMNFGWFDANTADQEIRRTTLHEFGHALGCVHEHQSPAAAGIDWNEENVKKHFQTVVIPPWTDAEIYHALYFIYDKGNTDFSAFDTQSIMIYWIPPEWTDNGFTTPENTDLSARDKSEIAKYYPRTAVGGPHTVTVASITCHDPQETRLTGNDEIHLRLYVDGQYLPVSHTNGVQINSGLEKTTMKKGDKWSIGKSVTFNQTLEIQVWELDDPKRGDAHDRFGTAVVTTGGSKTESFSGRAGAGQVRRHSYSIELK